MRNLFKRLKSQRGMSGVLVSMLLVAVGVGLVVGVKTFMTTSQATITTKATTAIDNATAATPAP